MYSPRIHEGVLIPSLNEPPSGLVPAGVPLAYSGGCSDMEVEFILKRCGGQTGLL